MTLNEYILNPMGKSNAVMSAITREAQRNNYKGNFNQVLVRESGNIDYRCYKDDKNNQYWFHCKVPSEHVKKFYYDVVFKFYADAESGTKNNLFDWKVQFYSNDPAFVYTYVYAFNQKDLFIKELQSKMSKTALTTPSKEKNPSEMIGYCKIIFFAYLVMENRNLNKKNIFEANISLFNPKEFMQSIDDADAKVEERQAQKVSYAKKKVIDQATYNRAMKSVGGGSLNGEVNITTTRKINKVHNVSTVGTIKRTSKISRKK